MSDSMHTQVETRRVVNWPQCLVALFTGVKLTMQSQFGINLTDSFIKLEQRLEVVLVGHISHTGPGVPVVAR